MNMKTHNSNTCYSLKLPQWELFNDVIADFIIELPMSKISMQTISTFFQQELPMYKLVHVPAICQSMCYTPQTGYFYDPPFTF